MEYNKGTSGGWVDADTVTTGDKFKIVSECTKQESRFKDKEGNAKTENIVKVRFKGADESKNMRLNWTTIYALIDAFGKDSKEWVGKVLTLSTVDAMVGDTMRTIMYLIPEGFELKKTDEKKMIISRVGGLEVKQEEVKSEESEEISPDDIPF